ncbi:hypothetical protein BCR34DRAFT_583950 [Clohesyomyces aquaticus]|uniref:Uncharacterized protein n=1 Tax=Clohesyomyces aquaticus TaxID=1231657 RepID=A0A1Y2A2W9_9PLEO|nr:hypothetical protein BCR34DRAFT_583950 [Clohesyomyces aquaticus]
MLFDERQEANSMKLERDNLTFENKEQAGKLRKLQARVIAATTPSVQTKLEKEAEQRYRDEVKMLIQLNEREGERLPQETVELNQRTQLIETASMALLRMFSKNRAGLAEARQQKHKHTQNRLLRWAKVLWKLT